MAYMTTSTLVARPAPSRNSLGDIWDTIKGGASSALDFFGSGLKAQGAAEALQAQATAQAQAQAQAQAARGGGGIDTKTLVIGGAVLAGVLVFAMRRK